MEKMLPEVFSSHKAQEEHGGIGRTVEEGLREEWPFPCSYLRLISASPGSASVLSLSLPPLFGYLFSPFLIPSRSRNHDAWGAEHGAAVLPSSRRGLRSRHQLSRQRRDVSNRLPLCRTLRSNQSPSSWLGFLRLCWLLFLEEGIRCRSAERPRGGARSTLVVGCARGMYHATALFLPPRSVLCVCARVSGIIML